MIRTVLPSQRTRTTETSRREMSLRTLVPFFALSFGLSWGVIAALIIFPAPVEAVFGEMGYTNPLFILAVYAPGFAGAFLVWRHYDLRGLGSFFRRLTLWRMPLVWWLVLLVGMPAVFYAGAVLKGTISDPSDERPRVARRPAVGHAGLRRGRDRPAEPQGDVGPRRGRDRGAHAPQTRRCTRHPALGKIRSGRWQPSGQRRLAYENRDRRRGRQYF